MAVSRGRPNNKSGVQGAYGAGPANAGPSLRRYRATR